MRLQIKASALVISVLLLALTGCSESRKFSEGQHYKTYEHVTDDLIQVLPEIEKASLIEFFSYGCIHCRDFAPKLADWQKNNPYSSLAYVPVIWDEETELYASIFYLIQSSPNFHTIHHELFDFITRFSRTDSLDDKKVAIVTFLQDKGIQPIDVVNALNNGSMQTKTAASLMLVKRFEIKGTPSLVVGGKYKIDNQSVSNHEELLDIVSELIRKEG